MWVKYFKTYLWLHILLMLQEPKYRLKAGPQTELLNVIYNNFSALKRTIMQLVVTWSAYATILWNTTIPQIEIKERAEICYRANFKVKDTYDFMGAGISIKMQNYKGGVHGKNCWATRHVVQQFFSSSTRTVLLLLVNILIFEVASVISLGWFLEVSSPKQI